MPFTPAHTVAALPFRKTFLETSAIVIGCLSPDFEYFLRLEARGGIGHTFTGLFVFDLPLSLAVLWLFQRYVKIALFDLSPKLFPFTPASEKRFTAKVKHLPILILSILIGATTHIVWDSFTHPAFWPYRHLSLLRMRFPVPVAGTVELYKLLQHGSTLLGMTLLLILWRKWVCSTSNRQAVATKPLAPLLVIAALIGGAGRAIAGQAQVGSAPRASLFASQFIVTSIALLWVELLLYGAARSRHILESCERDRIQVALSRLD